LLRRGWAYIVAKAPELALADFDEAIRLDPTDADAFSGRATARVHLSRYQEAVADSEEALARDKKSSTVAYKAARVYAQAATAAAADVERKGRAAVALTSRYQDRAVALVREAVQRLRAERRPSFWRDVLADPDLRPLRKRLSTLAMSDSVAAQPKPSN
jgi:tetratricopeptide (TPR) repeat protein